MSRARSERPRPEALTELCVKSSRSLFVYAFANVPEMTDRPDDPPAPPSPDLDAAIRRARIERAEQAELVSDLRAMEIARLQLLEGAIKPVLAQIPPEVDMFDLAIAPGERPRLFLDMISFVEMAHDRRTYRFYQDTRYGRVLIAESPKIERVVAAMTNYIARRLVERERFLAADWREAEPAAAREPASQARPREAAPPRAERQPGAREAPSRATGVLGFLILTLGWISLFVLVAGGGFLALTHRLGAFWSALLAAAQNLRTP